MDESSGEIPNNQEVMMENFTQATTIQDVPQIRSDIREIVASDVQAAESNSKISSGALTITIDSASAFQDIITRVPSGDPLDLLTVPCFKAIINIQPSVSEGIPSFTDISSFFRIAMHLDTSGEFSPDRAQTICELRTHPDRICLASWLMKLNTAQPFCSTARINMIAFQLSKQDAEFEADSRFGRHSRLTSQEFQALADYFQPTILYAKSSDGFYYSTTRDGTSIAEMITKEFIFLHNKISGRSIPIPPGSLSIGPQQLEVMLHQVIRGFVSCINDRLSGFGDPQSIETAIALDTVSRLQVDPDLPIIALVLQGFSPNLLVEPAARNVINTSIHTVTNLILPEQFRIGIKIDISCQNCVFNLASPIPVSSMHAIPTTDATANTRAIFPCLLSFGITPEALALRDYERLTPLTPGNSETLKKRQWFLTALQHPSQIHAATNLSPILFARHTTRHPDAIQSEINVLTTHLRGLGVDVTLVLPILILQNTKMKGTKYNVTQPEMVYAIYANSETDFADTSIINRIQSSCPRVFPLMSSLCELHSTQATIISHQLLSDEIGIKILQPKVSIILIRGLTQNPGPISDIVAIACTSTEAAQSITGAFLASTSYGSELVIYTSNSSFPPINAKLFASFASTASTSPAIEILRMSTPYGRRSFLHNRDIRVTSRYDSNSRYGTSQPYTTPSTPLTQATPNPNPNPVTTPVQIQPTPTTPLQLSGSARGNTRWVQPGRGNRGGLGPPNFIYNPSILPASTTPTSPPTTSVPPYIPPTTISTSPTTSISPTFTPIPINHSLYSLSTSSPIQTQPYTTPSHQLVSHTSNNPILAAIIAQANATQNELTVTRTQLSATQSQLTENTQKLSNIETMLSSLLRHINPAQPSSPAFDHAQ